MKAKGALTAICAITLVSTPAGAGTRAWNTSLAAYFPAGGAAGVTGTASLVPRRKSTKVKKTHQLIGGSLYGIYYLTSVTGLIGGGNNNKSPGAN